MANAASSPIAAVINDRRTSFLATSPSGAFIFTGDGEASTHARLPSRNMCVLISLMHHANNEMCRQFHSLLTDLALQPFTIWEMYLPNAPTLGLPVVYADVAMLEQDESPMHESTIPSTNP